MKKKLISMLVASSLLLVGLTSAAIAAPVTSENVPNTTTAKIRLEQSTKSTIANEIQIYAKLTTSWNAVYFDFYGEPHNDFTATWQKKNDKGVYVTEQTWELRFNDKGWYPGSWGQGAGTSWKLILKDLDNGSTATYTYTIG